MSKIGGPQSVSRDTGKGSMSSGKTPTTNFDINALQNVQAMKRAAQQRLVDSWLGEPQKTNAESTSEDPKITDGKDDRAEEDDLAALARSQRLGLGKIEGGTSSLAKSKLREDDDLSTLRQQLRLKNPRKANRGPVTQGQGRLKRRDSLSSDDSEDQGRSRAVGGKINAPVRRKPPHTFKTDDSAGTLHVITNGAQAGLGKSEGAFIPEEAPISSTKRKPASFLDEILNERQSKKRKSKKKGSIVVASSERHEPDVIHMRVQPGAAQNTARNEDDQSVIALNDLAPSPQASVPETSPTGYAQNTVGDPGEESEQPEEMKDVKLASEETEVDRKRRKNKEKKQKFKQKQKQRKVEKLEAG